MKRDHRAPATLPDGAALPAATARHSGVAQAGTAPQAPETMADPCAAACRRTPLLIVGSRGRMGPCCWPAPRPRASTRAAWTSP